MYNPDSSRPDLIAILGHTAGGKTTLAAHLARRIGGEVISADSRQIYRGMDVGTGKDLGDYIIDGTPVPYHLIDIADAGSQYSLFDFKRDFNLAFKDIRERGKLPVLCGGTGLYAESVLKGFSLTEARFNPVVRNQLAGLSDEALARKLASLVPLHNTSDTQSRARLVRAIEIALATRDGAASISVPVLESRVFAVTWPTDQRRERITRRLQERLENGMIEEVRKLLETVPPESLLYYGLEYKYLTRYCLGESTYDEMVAELNTAIHQFAKRQMTWFRGMERRGVPITWIAGELPLEEKLEIILK
jgi:tRNA dimethylallyltransferase